MRGFLLALTCSLAPLAVQAQTYQSFNRLNVVPINKTDFEVIEARGEGPRGMWCAAADYAQNAQGRTGVVFSTRTTGGQQGTIGSISLRQKGYSLLVNHAIQFCEDYRIDINDIAWRTRGDG